MCDRLLDRVLLDMKSKQLVHNFRHYHSASALIHTTSSSVLLLHVGAAVVIVATEWDDRFVTATQKLKLCETDERRLAKAWAGVKKSA